MGKKSHKSESVEVEEKAEKVVAAGDKRSFHFPSLGVTVKASSLDEAVKLVESNNK